MPDEDVSFCCFGRKSPHILGDSGGGEVSDLTISFPDFAFGGNFREGDVTLVTCYISYHGKCHSNVIRCFKCFKCKFFNVLLIGFAEEGECHGSSQKKRKRNVQ